MPETKKTIYPRAWVILFATAVVLYLVGVLVIVTTHGPGAIFILAGVALSLVANWKFKPQRK